MISTVPERDLIKQFEEAGGKGKPRYGQVTVCYAASEDEAAHTVRKGWQNAGIDALAHDRSDAANSFRKDGRTDRAHQDYRGRHPGSRTATAYRRDQQVRRCGIRSCVRASNRPEAGTVLSILYGESASEIQYHTEIIERLGAPRSQSRQRARGRRSRR